MDISKNALILLVCATHNNWSGKSDAIKATAGTYMSAHSLPKEKWDTKQIARLLDELVNANLIYPIEEGKPIFQTTEGERVAIAANRIHPAQWQSVISINESTVSGLQ